MNGKSQTCEGVSNSHSHSLCLNEHLQMASESQDLALELSFKLLSILRMLRFAGPSLGLSELTKAKVRHKSPYESSYQWDAGESLKRTKEPESSRCDLDKHAVVTFMEKLLTQTLRTLSSRPKTSSD